MRDNVKHVKTLAKWQTTWLNSLPITIANRVRGLEGASNNRALVLQDSIGSLIMAIEYQVWYQSDTLVTL